MIKVLNLYAGIGGNRKLWKNVEVTAIENNKQIAKVYQGFFPQDKLIVTDAHQYLLEHYKEFDFIWSSPPCPTHSKLRTSHPESVMYPDMRLYQEIIFLKHWFKGKWVVENVKSYYNPLIKPYECDRHYFWSNFVIPNISFNINKDVSRVGVKELQKYHGFNLDRIKLKNKRLVLRNCVNPKLGLHVFNYAFKEKQERLV